MSGRTPSIDKCGAEPGEHAAFYAYLFLWLDFGSELTDLHKGPWELHLPEGLNLEGDPFPFGVL
jgi:hypothetical protein